MKNPDGKEVSWRDFWADVRRDYRSIGPEMRESLRQMREEWWETRAAIREARHWDFRLRQKITGLERPTRKDVRRAVRDQRRQERRDRKEGKQ